MRKMTYRHRNRDRKPPEIGGWYWFSGYVIDDEDYTFRAPLNLKYVGQPSKLAAMSDDGEHILDYVENLIGEWNGPFPFDAPWDTYNGPN